MTVEQPGFVDGPRLSAYKGVGSVFIWDKTLSLQYKHLILRKSRIYDYVDTERADGWIVLVIPVLPGQGLRAFESIFGTNSAREMISQAVRYRIE